MTTAQVPEIEEMVRVDGLTLPVVDGPFTLDEDDFLLYGMLLDPVYMPELMWKDPKNFEFGGQYRVRDYQYIINRIEDNYAIVSCARSVGKALADDELVITPDGWIPVAALAVGDHVIGSDGNPTRVLGVFPQGERDLYDVEFADGTTIRCDDDHLWWVTCDCWHQKGRRGKKGPRTRTTKQLRTSAMRYKVPLPAVTQFRDGGRLPLSPWALGCLLGDGSFTTRSMISFSSAEVEMADRLQIELADAGELVHDRKIDYYIRAPVGSKTKAPRVLTLFRDWGLHPSHCSELRVPDEYLYASETDRLDLLRGLTDSDGTVTNRGAIEISVSSVQLANDVRHLALSLGGRASIRHGRGGYKTKNGRYTPCLDRHRVVFQLPGGVCPCGLGRKVAAWEANSARRNRDTMYRGIRAIVSAGRGNATCISVAASDGLFLAGDYVLTHNTESAKVHAEIHPLDSYDKLLITAPELIHLLPLTDAIEDNIRANPLLVEFLDTRSGQTGFQHRPFQVNTIDGTKIIGRIPKVTGTGVKGQHEDKLIVEEGQDYPERGWTEVNETVNFESRDRDGEPNFRFWIYGVHSGNKASGFDERARSQVFRKIKVTALRRPDWNADRKANAIAAYGGTSSPDYKRNILGEPGAGTTAYFVTARVMACVDQNVTRGEKQGSDYNTNMYVQQRFRAEELDDLGMQIGDLLDLPDIETRGWWGGVDVGLADSPTVISLFADIEHQKKRRVALMRRFTLERFRERQIREALYAIGWHFGTRLLGVGIDVTGLGKPIFQALEDDELCPPHLKNISVGYTFNSKVEVGVDENMVTDNQGVLRDHLGNMVKVVEDEYTGEKTFIVMMPFIAASTAFIRQEVDSGALLLPFDTDVTSDMLQETKQRVDRIGQRGESGGGTAVKKGDRFHILDSFRAAFYRRRQDEIMAQLTPPPQGDVLDLAGLDGSNTLPDYTIEQMRDLGLLS